MKRTRILFLLLAAVLLLTGCGGRVNELQREIVPSSVYTDAEIKDAMDVAIVHFKKEFGGCHMTKIYYSDEKSLEAGEAWAENYDDDEGIVLLSDFTVDSSGGDGSLTPNSTYNNWQWILTRPNGGKWVLRTWGYG